MQTQKQTQIQKYNKSFDTFQASIASSVVEVCITHPIDVIKNHLQTSKPIVYNLRNLYAGFIPRALGNIPSRTIFLYSQDYLHEYFKQRKLSNWSCLLVPIGSGFFQTLVDTPVEVLKMNKIMNITNSSLYKGFLPHLCRNTIFIFSVYNFRQYSEQNGGDNKQKIMYGMVGGLIGSYITHPIDTIKTHIQSNKSYAHLSPLDYFKGCNLRGSISMINMMISLSIFELLKK